MLACLQLIWFIYYQKEVELCSLHSTYNIIILVQNPAFVTGYSSYITWTFAALGTPPPRQRLDAPHPFGA